MKDQESVGTEHVIFTLSLTFVLILGTLVYTYFSPRQKSNFLELSVLENGKVTDSRRGLEVGEAINLTLCINNKFGREVQTVVNLIISNQTTVTMPLRHNSLNLFEGVIKNEERLAIPLSLKIEEISMGESYVSIHEISINGERYEIESARSVNGSDFRFIFSLHEYNLNTTSIDDSNQLWNQIWFNLTTT